MIAKSWEMFLYLNKLQINWRSVAFCCFFNADIMFLLSSYFIGLRNDEKLLYFEKLSFLFAYLFRLEQSRKSLQSVYKPVLSTRFNVEPHLQITRLAWIVFLAQWKPLSKRLQTCTGNISWLLTDAYLHLAHSGQQLQSWDQAFRRRFLSCIGMC